MDEQKFELERSQVLLANFRRRVAVQDLPIARSTTSLKEAGLSPATTLDIFTSQVQSRHLDTVARELKTSNQGFYTIGSSGHEGNAVLGEVLRQDDMLFLHYRSCALMLQRARKYSGDAKVYDHLLAIVASADDPVAAGRHKVFGSVELNVPPQTSTIASHLPKAVGTAFTLAISHDLKISNYSHHDSIIFCSFGDASLNHSTAQGAINTAQWISQHRLPLPLVFLCEDNGLGISVPTMPDWVQKNIAGREGLIYIHCDGLNIADIYQATQKACHIARTKKQPVFIHLQTVRLLGHAGSDIESQYRSQQAVIQDEADDPLLHTARILLENNIIDAKHILAIFNTEYEKVKAMVPDACSRPKLATRSAVLQSLVENSELPKIRIATPEKFANMCQALNSSLSKILEIYPQSIIFGEDVGGKGGVYRVTADLQNKYGIRRVFDSPLDEQTILGTAIGAAHNGLLPIPEIQFLAYLHNAIDQVRGEAATLSFFSNTQYQNPMVIRLPSFAYQKGFGGHFHNENSLGPLLDIPEIIMLCPSCPHSAYVLMQQAANLAISAKRIVLLHEPIALYFNKELTTLFDKNNELHGNYGEFGVTCSGQDFCIITYGNGVNLAMQAAQELSSKNIHGKIIDLRWLKPIAYQELAKEVAEYNNILIVDECRSTGNLADQIIANLTLLQIKARFTKIAAADCFIPLGDSPKHILPNVEDIIAMI